MPLGSEIGRVLDALEHLVGKTIMVEESISRDRSHGHDRHWSTSSRFTMVVRRFFGTISGAQLILEGDDVWYAIAASAIATATFEPELVIAERFEQQTERRTTIRIG